MFLTEARKINSWKWKGRDLTWEAFVDLLGKKFSRTPETMVEYAAMSKADRDTIKALPGCFVGARLNSGRRLLQNVVSRTMLTLDGDYATTNDWANFTCLHDDLAVVCYPTHSSRPNKPRLRWVLPVSREMTPDESSAVARRVAEWIGIETMDPTTFDLNRAMYYPSVPHDAPYELKVQWGKPVDVDAVLASYGAGEAWKDASLWPTSDREQEIPKAADGKKPDDPTTKNGVLGLFCRTYDVETAIAEFLPDVYEETTTPGRYTYSAGSTSGGAIIYNGGAFLYSNHATDPAGGRSVNAFDLVRIHKFGGLDDKAPDGTPVTKLPSYAAMCEWAMGLPDVRRQAAEERKVEADAAFGDLIAPDDDVDRAGDDVAPEETETDDSWMTRLECLPKSTELRVTIQNVSLILLNDPALKGHIVFNEFSGRKCAVDPLPWSPKGKGLRNWTDRDEASLLKYLEIAHRLYNAKGAMQQALSDLENIARIHPVRDYLNGLEWDGTPRLDTMLVRFMHAEDTQLCRAISRHWMMAACARIFHPGIKFDPLLVLVTPTQGVGKSMFGQILACHGENGRDWFKDGLSQIGTKDAMQELRGHWIVEVGEMAATKKADDDAIKQFFSCDTDTYRESYGRNVETFPRQCVFFGTTNNPEFIMDTTGGRRFWPVDVDADISDTKERMQALREERDQLWAEAMMLMRQSERKGTLANDIWIKDSTLVGQLLDTQATHTQDDEWLGLVQAYLDRPLPENWDSLTAAERRSLLNSPPLPGEDRSSWTRRRDTVTISEIRNELLCEDVIKGAGGGNPSSRHLGRIMTALSSTWVRAVGKTAREDPISLMFGRQKFYRRRGSGDPDWLK